MQYQPTYDTTEFNEEFLYPQKKELKFHNVSTMRDSSPAEKGTQVPQCKYNKEFLYPQKKELKFHDVSSSYPQSRNRFLLSSVFQSNCIHAIKE